jgi:CBS domain-containing protein
VTIAHNAPLFDALATMIRHQVHRLVVTEVDRVVGLLEQLDLLSFLSNHSYLITLQIVQASDIETLARCSRSITRLIELLWRNGTRVGAIARLVQELDAKLFERAWQLVAPAALVANSCLFVMGSEGRGEQLLKTDQDNGLVLRDGYEPPRDLDAICQRFSDALAEFGYPECPGRIMVSDPQWRQPAEEFAQTVRRWLLKPDAESLMALAIFIDAHAVCGDAALLEQVRGEVFRLVIDNDVLCARFAAAIDAFEQQSGWWTRLLSFGEGGEPALDLKKAGIFPLVHGVRTLALHARLECTGTVDRIEALRTSGTLADDLAADLIDSLHFLMGLKLEAGLGASAGNGRLIHVDKLSSLQRNLLKDALATVKRFKAVLRQRYPLDML